MLVSSTVMSMTARDRIFRTIFLAAIAMGAGCHRRRPAPGSAEVARLDHLACDGGDMAACARLADVYSRGRGVARDPVLAVTFARRACSMAPPRGCAVLAAHYLDGEGVALDTDHATTLADRHCTAGDMDSCAVLARLQTRRIDYTDPPGLATGVALARRACNGRSALGCITLAAFYARGYGVALDRARALALYQRSCDSVEHLGCRVLGEMYLSAEARDRDEARGKGLLSAECDRGDLVACASLGWTLILGADRWLNGTLTYDPSSGWGDINAPLTPGQTRGLRLVERACEGGERAECGRLARWYLSDRSPREWARAVPLLGRLCEGGDPSACFELGNVFLPAPLGQGDSPERPAANPERALRSYERACTGGIGFQCLRLAERFARGTQVTADPRRVTEFHVRGCDALEPTGCALAARAYRDGTGVPRDPARAATLFQLACVDGLYETCSELMALPASPAIAQSQRAVVAVLEAECSDARRWACEIVGDLWSRNEGLPRDIARATVYRRRACPDRPAENSHARYQFCLGLGRAHRDGEGVARDNVRALGLFVGACESGSAEACGELLTLPGETPELSAALHNSARTLTYRRFFGRNSRREGILAMFYLSGRGVRRDVGTACRLFEFGCASGEQPNDCSEAARLQTAGRCPEPLSSEGLPDLL